MGGVVEAGRIETQKHFDDMRSEVTKQLTNMHEDMTKIKAGIIGSTGN